MHLERGVELIRSGAYFDAHEELELAWRAAPADERDFYQGLVHVAVAWYQAGRGNRVGCERQLAKARRRLGPYATAFRGIDVAALLAQVDAAAARVETGSLELEPATVDAPPRLYPSVEPYDRGLLAVGGDDAIYWETCGNPAGKPAVAVHGGPGSGASPWLRRLFDPERYRIVLFDQRRCGRSTPHAGEPGVGLDGVTTERLVRDLVLLREHLGVDRWLLVGGSWGSTLALAYAEAHPEQVSGLVLFGVMTSRRSELDWTFRGGLGRLFPAQWQRLVDALPPAERSGDVVATYARLLADPDPAVHEPAAYEWCLWESAIARWPPPDGLARQFQDPRFRLCFARQVTHLVAADAWLDDGALLDGAAALRGIPGVLVNGRLDLQAPLANAWTLARAWPDAELVVVDAVGHAPAEAVERELVRATDRFAR